jgi:hypothetical protein
MCPASIAQTFPLRRSISPRFRSPVGLRSNAPSTCGWPKVQDHEIRNPADDLCAEALAALFTAIRDLSKPS